MKKTIFIFAIMIASTIASNAKIVSKAVDYKDGDTQLQGWIYYDDGIKSPKPAVIVVHEWWGLNDYPKMRAQQLADLGYIAFAADIYGKGVIKTDFDEAGAEAGKYRSNIPLLRSRINSALETLKKQPNVDKNKIAAIGYCFGGGTVLELARSGADIKGVVSFHGNLGTPNPADAKNIKGKVLVCHGGDDKFVSNEEFLGFENEMRNANVDWQINIYGNSVHGFTNPANGSDNSTGLAYNEKADKRSFEAMKQFLKEIFK